MLEHAQRMQIKLVKDLEQKSENMKKPWSPDLPVDNQSYNSDFTSLPDREGEKELAPDGTEEKKEREKKHTNFTLCNVCNIQLNSAAQAQIHYNGKSHQKRLKQLSNGNLKSDNDNKYFEVKAKAFGDFRVLEVIPSMSIWQIAKHWKGDNKVSGDFEYVLGLKDAVPIWSADIVPLLIKPAWTLWEEVLIGENGRGRLSIFLLIFMDCYYIGNMEEQLTHDYLAVRAGFLYNLSYSSVEEGYPRAWQYEKQKRPWLCMSPAQQKHLYVINSVFSTNLKHNHLSLTMKKMNLIRAKTRTMES
ncbi:hypothetical protein HGM15179_001343 [Zosterops borbonicus]|uniref:U1-type domain-containing protein n=1 Tax=Zosterops borbonicus TaxID=364589 RepID=A0A8K1LTR4_9PASS|nr:hypothetical protein HGM15179_001343 [Zosterops borbonicus]